jgi:hypothetical protein
VQGGLVISCLTWVQLARVKILMYPHNPSYTVLAAGIVEGEENGCCCRNSSSFS